MIVVKKVAVVYKRVGSHHCGIIACQEPSYSQVVLQNKGHIVVFQGGRRKLVNRFVDSFVELIFSKSTVLFLNTKNRSQQFICVSQQNMLCNGHNFGRLCDHCETLLKYSI
jgi:hypothetical protein